MKPVSIVAPTDLGIDELERTLVAAAAEVAGYSVTRRDERTLLVAHQETPWWLLGIFAPAARRPKVVVVRVADGAVDAEGTATNEMARFLEAYLLDDENQSLAPRLRELAASR